MMCICFQPFLISSTKFIVPKSLGTNFDGQVYCHVHIECYKPLCTVKINDSEQKKM